MKKLDWLDGLVSLVAGGFILVAMGAILGGMWWCIKFGWNLIP